MSEAFVMVSEGWTRLSLTGDLHVEQYQNRGRFEVFTAVTTKNALIWDSTPCGSYKNRRLGGTYIVSISSQRDPVAIYS
jgi:hypothetical protein